MPDTDTVWTGEDDLRARLVPIADLRPDPKNGRAHGERSIAETRRSLDVYGQQKPIVVTADGETIAGAGTLQAATEAGWTHLAAVRSSLADDARRGYAIADNRTSELSTWDVDRLADELRDLNGEEELSLGFDPDEIAALLGPGGGGGGGGGGDGGGGDGGGGANASLAERFIVPPMSVLDSRQGYWQTRKQQWLDVGIASHEGRAENELGYSKQLQAPHFYEELKQGIPKEKLSTPIAMRGTSIFDPVLCELLLRWFAPSGGAVLDPFAGGSVRGIVSSILGYRYTGVELREDQVKANRKQAKEVGDRLKPKPAWKIGDAKDAIPDLRPTDFVLSCPPYFDLEQYSEDPRDLSNMSWEEFLAAYREVVSLAVDRLKPNRFAGWVVSEIRDQKTGACRSFVHETIRAFLDAGAVLYNEMSFVQPICTGGVKISRTFAKGRKVNRTHQNVLVFLKGDGDAALADLGPIEEGSLPPDEEGEAAAADGSPATEIGGEI